MNVIISKIPSLALIAFGLGTIMMPCRLQADDFNPNTGTSILFPIKPGTGAKPKAPSRVYIECYYSTGSLTFVLPPSIYSTTVDLSNDRDTWSGFVTRDQPTLDIPDLEGEYTIKCNADDGKTYIGTLEF